MESTWLLFPGQTLANTKVSERSHALHINVKNWGNITRNLDRVKIKQETVDKEETWKRYLKDGSKRMMANWENSLENIRRKKEEERLRQIAQKKDDRMQKFFELRKEQEKMRAEYVDKVKKQIFRTTGYAKQLTSGFIESEVLYEREKQKEFEKFLKNHEAEEEAKYANEVNENAKKEEDEKREQQRKKKQKEKEYGQYLKSVITSKKETEDKRKEKKIKKEELDNIMAMEEMECLKKAEENEKMRKKQEMFIEKTKVEKNLKEKKRQTEKEDKEMNDVINIYQETKHRIDCLKKAREKEIQDAIVARRAAVAELVGAKQVAKDEEQEKQLKKVIAEREAAEEARLLEKLEFHRKMREDRIEDRTKYIEREKHRKQKETELKKWEMLNRYKSDEVLKKYDEDMKKEQWRKILEYRKELLEQIDENQEETRNERDIERIISKNSLNTSQEDRKFFEYANEVMEQAKRRGRSTYPIEKVIMQYKKANSLPMNSDERCINHENEKDNTDGRLRVQKSEKTRHCRCNNIK